MQVMVAMVLRMHGDKAKIKRLMQEMEIMTEIKLFSVFHERTNVLAMKDEAGSKLNNEENDFMLDTSYGEETMEDLTAAFMLMAQIQPVDVVESSNSVRRPNFKGTKSKNRVLKNTKSSSTYVRKISRSVSIDSNKCETKDLNVFQTNASVSNSKTLNVVNDRSNIVCVSCGKNVFLLSHEKCVARYALFRNSNVKRALCTTPVATNSKNLGATSVVAKSRLSVANNTKATNKVTYKIEIKWLLCEQMVKRHVYDEPMWTTDRVVAPTLGFTITIPEIANEFSIKGNIIKIFYHGLSEITQEVLNAATGGIFLYKTPNQAYQLLEDKVLLKFDWAKNQKTKSSLEKTVAFADEGSSNTDTDKIMTRMDAMTIKIDAQYKELQSRAKQPTPDLNDDDMPMSREEEAKFMQTFRNTRFYNDYGDRDLNRANWHSSGQNDYH
uniref:Reverse transcriptase domain-containing protein n=1 Tax=Tanacetum cinerariifolium TaxID=118510 RepID=A0A6L2P994_TANCI|nr:hypothetical protein [Tanacetum cinerariifolium]